MVLLVSRNINCIYNYLGYNFHIERGMIDCVMGKTFFIRFNHDLISAIAHTSYIDSDVTQRWSVWKKKKYIRSRISKLMSFDLGLVVNKAAEIAQNQKYPEIVTKHYYWYCDLVI